MLASIHPLGERARKNRWVLTVTAYLIGSIAGGATLGWALGLVGAPLTRLMGPPPVWILLGTAAGAGALFDLGLIPGRLPSPRRQVNEEWLTRYRGWVYGVGFGYQLGLGVVTIVTSATVYLAFVVAALSGSPWRGALIGGTFGLVRALPLLTTGRIRGPHELRRWHVRFQRTGRVARQAGVAVLVVSSLAPLALVL